MRHICAVLWKQLKDTLKNKTSLIQFVMFPALTLIMENAIEIKGMHSHFFATLFAVMYIGMAPLTSMAAIISEEKERNTLRVLRMSNVKPWEYLLGVGIYIWGICMLGSLVIALAAKYSGNELINFLLLMALGIFVSILFGAAIGTWSKGQMMATSITVPVMMVFSFLPMLSMFNETISKVAKFTYTQQMNLLFQDIVNIQWEFETICVMIGNVMLATILFVIAYNKSGLE